ncbi:MAG: 4-hydroxythreonine-4-phosphate dehydrogenase PdxA [Candidatus Eiseniibacteriota bacterium]
MKTAEGRPVALTMGEPAGIGGELSLKAWLARDTERVPAFFAIDDPARLAALGTSLGLKAPVRAIEKPADAARVFAGALPVLPETLPRPAAPGRPDPANAPAVIASIRRAVELALAGEASAVVTNPIQKKVLMDAGFAHAGHTEYLGELAGPRFKPVMMLACPGLRVVPVTVHVSLAEALRLLSTDRIVAAGRAVAEALKRDFGFATPRLAVAGLNPHAGEDGALGREDAEIVAPAVAALRAEGIDARGPLSPDTMFHEAARARYDAAVCMYHDQALIPLKTLDFFGGVNVTLGLPFVRTSPDHGTAPDIAGKGLANPASLMAALRLAHEMAAHRDAARAAERVA